MDQPDEAKAHATAADAAGEPVSEAVSVPQESVTPTAATPDNDKVAQFKALLESMDPESREAMMATNHAKKLLGGK